jgi:hypothetical protein
MKRRVERREARRTALQAGLHVYVVLLEAALTRALSEKLHVTGNLVHSCLFLYLSTH